MNSFDKCQKCNKYEKEIESAKEQFGKLLEKQLKRVEAMKAQGDFIDYSKLDKIVIGTGRKKKNTKNTFK